MPAARGHLRELGLSRGWRCLEIGPGAGSLARWVGDQADPGVVIAVDRDLRAFGETHRSNVHVVRSAIRDVDHIAVHDASIGEFDLVYARLVLMHLPERHQVLEKMLRWLRPGGRLMVSDALKMPCRTSEARAAMTLLFEGAAERVGTDPHWARSYPHPLVSVGLVDVHVAVDVPVLRGGSAYAFFVESTLRQLTAGPTGVIPDTAGTWLSQIEEPDYVDWPFAIVTAWGTRAAR